MCLKEFTPDRYGSNRSYLWKWFGILPNIEFSFNFDSTFLIEILEITGSCGSGAIDTVRKEISSLSYTFDFSYGESCNWLISENSGKEIELQFLDYETDGSNDYFIAYDGSSSNSRQIGSRISGSNTPINLVSTGNRLYLTYGSAGGSRRTRFKIKVMSYGKYH